MRLLLLAGFFTLYLLGIAKDSYATHAAGIDISYTKVVGSTNSYEFLIRFYRDCGNASTSTTSEPNSFQLCYTSPCTGTISSINCTKVAGNIATSPPVPNGTSLTNGCNAVTTCSNINSSIHGYRQWWYKGTVTLPVTCNYWRFWVSFCCRNAGTVNIGPLAANNYNIYCETTFNNTVSQNNDSPFFLYTNTPSTLPVPYCCINVPYFHFGGAQDNNGDSLTYHTVYPTQINTTNCSSALPQTILATNGLPAYNILNTNGNPLQTNNSYNLDTTTGYFSYTPSQLGHWTLCQRVDEYRNGVWLGSTMRDMYLVVDQCIPLPVVSGLDSLSVTGGSSKGDTVFSCPNQPIHFCMDIIDNINTAAWVSHVFDNHSVAFPNSTLVWTKPDTNILRVCVDWTPTLADTGSHMLYVNVTDSLDCLITPALVQLPVIVHYGLIAYGDTSVCAGVGVPLSTNSNSSISWTALPGGSGNGSLSCLTCPNPIASPSISTSYMAMDNACGYMDTVDISILPSPNLTITPASPSICVGQSVSLQVNGAGTYLWTNNSSTNPTISVSPSVTTIYTVTGTNSNGCSATLTVTVIVNPWPVLSVSASPAAICTGSSTTLNATGATNYLWQPGGFTGSPVVSPTTTTTYTVTGTNGNGCSSTATLTVTVFPLPYLTSNASPSTICVGASSSLTINGATNYLWQPGGFVGSTPVVAPTTTTTYTVSGTNLNGCTNTTTVTVTVNPLPIISANAAPSVICVGTTTQLNATGATSYVWQPGGLIGSPVVSPPTTTLYTVTGTNANGCTNTATVNVTVNSLPVVLAGASPNAICLGEASTLSATGAINYVWQPGGLTGNPTVTPTMTTTYTVIGTNGNGCSNATTVTITVNPLPTLTANALPTAICIGSSSILTVNGAATYLWQPGSLVGSAPMVTPITTTTYTVTGTNLNGCTNTTTLTVIVNPLPNVSASASPSVICLGTTSQLTANGATNYLWQPGGLSGNPVVSPSTTTQYTVTGTNANGCSNTDTVNLSVNPLPVVLAGASPNVICVGEAATLSASGANTYTWQPGSLSGSPTVNPITTTTYTVTGTNSFGCTATSTLTITVNPLPNIIANATPSAICIGDSATLSVSGASTYLWQPGGMSGSPIVNPIITTTYTVTGTGANGCSNTSVVSVFVNLNPNVTAGASPNIICSGASSTLSATGSNNYVWQPGGLIGSPLVNPMVTTTYTVTGTNISGCSNTSIVTVYVNPLIIAANSSPNSICVGSSSTLSATGGSSYVWQPGNLTGSPLVSPTTNTTYTVTGSTSNGCSNTAIVSVLVNPPPSITVKNIEYPVCSSIGNYSFDVDGSSLAGIHQYTLQPGNLSNSTGIFSQLYAGQFTVTVTDNYSCTNSTVITLPSPDLIELLSVSVSDDSCYFDIKNQVRGNVTGGVDPKIFYVVPGGMTNNNGIFFNLNPDQYYMVVTDSNGCSDTQPFNVKDHPCCSEPFVASAFSPNHDGLNDELHCIHYYGLTIEKFMVVNRYGNVVFKANNDQDSWDGTFQGSPCDVGTYFYLVRYRCEETNQKGILKGDVSLIR